MKLEAFFILVAALSITARASTITVVITGTTSAVRVEAGPIFGYSSYQKIPDGTAFTLIYTFDDTKGKEDLSQVSADVIVQSKVEATPSSSPGTGATLQIGSAMWEFGASSSSQVKLNTSPSLKSEQLAFFTPQSHNQASIDIRPAKGGYWPRNGDWRASFTANSLTGSTGSFSADNGDVSAQGKLVPSTITVTGVDIDGQWLSYTTIAGGSGFANWERQWHLAHVSRKGGYVVQQVARTIVGIKPDGSPITPPSIRYWEAWQVPAGSQITVPATDRFTNAAPEGSIGDESVSATARFYEGLTLPSAFAVGSSRYAGSHLSSTTDPNLLTSHATLPIAAGATLHF